MTEPHKTDNQVNQAASEENKWAKPKSWVSVTQGLLILAFGILVGALVAQRATDFLPMLLPNLMAIFIAFFLLIIILILALPRIIGWLSKRYMGKRLRLEEGLNEVQAKANHLAGMVATTVLFKSDSKVKQNIRHDLPIILNYLIFARLRNVGLRFLITVFIAIGGLLGTILLYNQNQLLTSQNQLLNNQNEKIDNQILLDEASRRSSLNFLMANVLDKVDEELKEAENAGKSRELSSQLIGRIISLSQSFQPYRYLDNGKMLRMPYSPERGHLLLALVNSNLDEATLDTIIRTANFKRSFLKGANLNGARLVGIDLEKSNLTGARLMRADLSDALLIGTNFRSANLGMTDFTGAEILGGDFTSAHMGFSRFIGAYVKNAIFENSNFFMSDLTAARFMACNFENAHFAKVDLAVTRGITRKELAECYSLREVRNLPDSLARAFKSRIENDPKYEGKSIF